MSDGDRDSSNAVVRFVGEHPVWSSAIGVAIAFTFCTAIWLTLRWSNPDTPDDRIAFIRTVAAAFGGLLLLVSLYFTRETLKTNQRTVDLNAQNTAATIRNEDLARLSQNAERFFKATSQLADDSVVSRCGALYALESIAIDSDRDYPQVVALITGFLRERCGVQQGEQLDPALEAAMLSETGPPRAKEDVQAAMTILGRRKYTLGNGEQFSLDLGYLDLSGIHIRDANFHGTNFQGGVMVGGSIENSDFSETNFGHHVSVGQQLVATDFRGSSFWYKTLYECEIWDRPRTGGLRRDIFERTSFGHADLTGTKLYVQDLTKATHVTATQLAKAHLVRGATVKPFNLEWWNIDASDREPSLRFDLSFI